MLPKTYFNSWQGGEERSTLSSAAYGCNKSKSRVLSCRNTPPNWRKRYYVTRNLCGNATVSATLWPAISCVRKSKQNKHKAWNFRGKALEKSQLPLSHPQCKLIRMQAYASRQVLTIPGLDWLINDHSYHQEAHCGIELSTMSSGNLTGLHVLASNAAPCTAALHSIPSNTSLYHPNLPKPLRDRVLPGVTSKAQSSAKTTDIILPA